MTSFIKLEDLLAPLPLPAIIAVLMTLGLKRLGGYLIRRLNSEFPDPLHTAAGFIAAAALVAALVHLLALSGLAYLWILRPLAWLLAALGLLELARLNREWWVHKYAQFRELLTEQSLAGKVAILLLAMVLVGFWLSVLGPPTDADSLDYHLGVPLDILRHHGAYPRPDWLHARLIGLGESLNMLGLAGGTDILGAALQFGGMVAVLAALISLTKAGADKLLVSMCVLGCPVAAFLLPNQKPQMLPIAATTVALILIVSRWNSIKPKTILLAFLLAFFAMACKYSFLLSGAIVVGLGMIAAYRAGIWRAAIGIALAAFLVLTFPVNLQNILFYGDPISPLLERFLPQGDNTVIRFASFLRDYSDSVNFVRKFPFPLNIVFPASPGAITTVLGLGALLPLVALRKIIQPGPPRIFLVCALLATAFNLLLGQLSARFFFEPYLWFVAAAATSGWRPERTLFFKLMVCQTLIMALIAGYGAVTLFPGSLTRFWRHKVMARVAYSYPETRWLNEVLPPEAVVLAAIHSNALMPRPALSDDMFLFNLEDRAEEEKFWELLARQGVNTLVLSFPLSEKLKRTLGPHLGPCLAGPARFPFAYRNPWNRGATKELVVYRLEANHRRGFQSGGRAPTLGVVVRR